ncbi:S8 family serine peptidase [Brevundimonas goettingensis]|uniref:S8 family serine peptidase n=1 Tax=Brevundimonas goettingensis TaxID=2774190 RepID=A0A975C3G4_9CAUL|nr:S8 family serine peptidase [Brevundimonas goettingensis]
MLLTTLALAAPAPNLAIAQVGLPGGGVSGGLGQIPSTLRDTVGDATSRVDALTGRLQDGAEDALRAPSRLTALIRRSRGALEADPQGWPVVSGELVAVGMTAEARRAALGEGFTVVREERLEALDLTTVVLAPPRGQSLSRALQRLQRLDPTGDYAFNHVHQPAGVLEPALPPAAPSIPPPQASSSVRLGLIDTGVEATHPALVGSRLIQRGFAGPPRMGAHGLAVASLMVGRTADFSGAAPGAALFVADVYGGSPAGGSSTDLAEALSWMVESRVQVVNISLVGPRNALVQAAVRQAEARGLTLVAAVGNDGPAAPPLYPAAYDGVVGVAPVDRRDRILPEAGRGSQVDLSAPGSDMAAAGVAGSWVTVRGASFASPLVAGLLAGESLSSLERSARDLGQRGPDPVYGQGLVGETLRTAPDAVGARQRLAN